MTNPIQRLLTEDDAADARLLAEMSAQRQRDGLDFGLAWIHSLESGRQSMADERLDVVLRNWGLAASTGLPPCILRLRGGELNAGAAPGGGTRVGSGFDIDLAPASAA